MYRTAELGRALGAIAALKEANDLTALDTIAKAVSHAQRAVLLQVGVDAAKLLAAGGVTPTGERSKGTRDMVQRARAHNAPLELYNQQGERLA